VLGARMPEAPVDEACDPLLGEGDVDRSPWHERRSVVHPVAQP
jgi:hypothetical protein